MNLSFFSFFNTKKWEKPFDCLYPIIIAIILILPEKILKTH